MFKVVGIAITCAIILVYLKSINSEYTYLALISSCIVVLSFTIRYLDSVFMIFNELKNKIGLDNEIYSIMLKVCAIGFVVDFGSGIIEDMGFKSLSDKLVFVGKIAIFSLSIPIISSLFDIITNLL